MKAGLGSSRLLLVTLLALVASACSVGSSAAPSGRGPSGAAVSSNGSVPSADLQVYAAASLKAALARASAAYEAAHPGTTVTVSTDSSAALETKIEQGAPADVLLSADMANAQKLAEAGLAAGSVVKFAGNLLTVIVPAANPAGIDTPADLARPGVKVIAAGDSVPITRYADQLVENLAKQPGYPAGFAARYAANVVSREDNVAAVVAKIALGEGDAGIAYVTDARAAGGVRTVDMPAGANVPATYGGVVVKGSANEAAASTFLAWLAGPSGQAVLATFGFLPAS